MISDFPSYWDAPSQLLMLDGCCGLVTAWGLLKYFKRRASVAKLIKACRYTQKHGTFMIALAVAFQEFGLSVTFYSDFDPDPSLIERRCFLIADRVGIRIEPSIRLNALLTQISSRSIPVALFNTLEGHGHISPLLGVEGRNVILPYSEEKLMPKRVFLKQWNEPEIFRQCMVVSN